MSARATLLSLYDQWQTCSHSEADAIREENWTALLESQSAKAALQPEIELWTEAALGELSGQAADTRALEVETSRILEHLIELENSNATLLASKRLNLTQQELASQASARNLRKLRDSYGTSPSTGWHSYS
jgi:hypothetical protein